MRRPSYPGTPTQIPEDPKILIWEFVRDFDTGGNDLIIAL
jgi:hypothetical protein